MMEAFTVDEIASQTLGQAFTVTGKVSGVSAVPTLQYQDAGGSWLSLPGGASVTTSTFSFSHPAINGATSTAQVSVRDANNTGISATSNTFSVVAAVETITIATITQQVTGSTFTVSGTVANAPAGLSLQFQDNSGAWSALPAGFSISGSPGTASFSFVHPAPTVASANNTVSIRDAANVGIHQTSDSFAVILAQSANDSVVLAGGTGSIVDALGETFTITSGGQVAVNGVPDNTTSSVVALAYVNGLVYQEAGPYGGNYLWFGKASASAAWTPPAGTTISPLPPESLAISTPTAQVQNVPFVVQGTITAALVVPTLQYQVSGGTWLPLTGPVNVSTFSFTVPGIATVGNATVAVRDANTPSITAITANFSVAAAAAPEMLTVAVIGNHPAGMSFIVSGAISNASTAPTLEYADDNGTFQPLPAGSVVTTTSWSFIHPGLPTSLGMTVTVRDHDLPSASVTSAAFMINGQESANNATVTTVGPQIIDSHGNVFTLTPAGQVAVNGVVDMTTASVVEIAYVGRVVWYETGAKIWFELNAVGNWQEVGIVGPLPSSAPVIYKTSLAPLAVVPNFTIPVPGIVLGDTIAGGAFDLTMTCTSGILTMPGATGSGTTRLSMSGPLSALNSAVATLTFTGKTVGTGAITVTLADADGAAAMAQIQVIVPRSAPALQAGARIAV